MSTATRPTDTRSQTSIGSRLRFLLRLTGLFALLAAAVGALIAFTLHPDLSNWNLTNLKPALAGDLESGSQWAAGLLVIGVAIAGLVLIVELLVGMFFAAGRRSAAGSFATLSVLLAVGLFGFVNTIAFRAGSPSHPLEVNGEPYRPQVRWDLTRDAEFTLPEHVRTDLAQLHDKTTVIVLQQHRMFGKLSEQSTSEEYLKDRKFELAAEAKVIEKVRDLIDQFRSFGAQFDVHVLDVNEDGFERRLDELIDSFPQEQRASLRRAIERSPEDSILFVADGRTQRLSFNEFYRLDKEASRDEANLVMLPQGVEVFTDRIFAIEERKPRVGLAVIHEILSSRNKEDTEYTLAGMRESLEAHGFEVVDIVLKDWTGQGPPKPAAFTYDESRLGEVESNLESMQRELSAFRQVRRALEEDLRMLEEAKSLAELDEKIPLRAGRKWTKTLRESEIASDKERIGRLNEQVAELETELQKVRQEREELFADERTVEQARMTDVPAKLRRQLDEIDLLILPRKTLADVTEQFRNIPARVHNLDEQQAEAIREFIKQGKPVLALFGPPNTPGRGSESGIDEGDDVETILKDLGIRMLGQTVLFDAEKKAFTQRDAGVSFGGAPADVPPLEVRPGDNPIGTSVVIGTRGLGQKPTLSGRHPRPIYVDEKVAKELPFDPQFLFTSEQSWNEVKPFLETELRQIPGTPFAQEVVSYMPRYDPPTRSDADADPLEVERRGPFSVGVAIETQPPASWYKDDSDEESRPTVRVVAVGHGGIFVGPNLKPAQEQVLLGICNWLLGREDRMPSTTDVEWRYPRVELSDQQRNLWWGIALVGMPLLCAFVGLIVLMFRQVR